MNEICFLLQSKNRILNESILRKDAEIDRLKSGILTERIIQEYFIDLNERIISLESYCRELRKKNIELLQESKSVI